MVLKKTKKFYSIGELAKLSDCSVQLIRHYEDIGLLTQIERSQSNRRLYTAQHLKSLLFIRHGRSMGFSIADITQLLSLKNKQGHNQEAHDIAQQHLQKVDERIRQLSELQHILQSIIQQCEQTSNDKPCPILALLDTPL